LKLLHFTIKKAIRSPGGHGQVRLVEESPDIDGKPHMMQDITGEELPARLESPGNSRIQNLSNRVMGSRKGETNDHTVPQFGGMDRIWLIGERLFSLIYP